MLKSMTGYGREEVIVGGQNAAIEVRSVNYRYLDVQSRTPRCLLPLEGRIRKRVSDFTARGKVEVAVQLGAADDGDGRITLNPEMTAHVCALLQEAKTVSGLPGDIDLSMLLSFQELVFDEKKEAFDEDCYWAALEPALTRALSSMAQMQAAEGREIEKDIQSRMLLVASVIDEIAKLAPEVLEAKKIALQQRIQELCDTVALDESRIVQEIAILADKSDITEEIVRARSHIKQFNRWLETEEPVGKKLDFLIQEINREVNTIGSKASDSEIALKVVTLKNEQEKIREQVQNVM